MLTRIVTALVGLVIFFVIVLSGTAVFTAAVSVVTLWMLFEIYNSMKTSKVLMCVGIVNSLLLLASIIFGGVSLEFAIAACICIYMTFIVVLHGKVNFREIGANALVTLFITIFFGSMIRINNDYGLTSVILVFVCAWVSDSGAYFAGRALGKHKLIPKVSPKKTVEGAIGGIISSGLACMLYVFILEKAGLAVPCEATYVTALVVGLFAAVFSQIGDLVMSAIKRDCDVKDFGNVLPGHGGVIDRFDSVIYITPVIYYLLVFISK